METRVINDQVSQKPPEDSEKLMVGGKHGIYFPCFPKSQFIAFSAEGLKKAIEVMINNNYPRRPLTIAFDNAKCMCITSTVCLVFFFFLVESITSTVKGDKISSKAVARLIMTEH